jgi:hypothetical protein
MVDRDDIRTVYFRDPTTHGWHRLEWEHAAQVDAPSPRTLPPTSAPSVRRHTVTSTRAWWTSSPAGKTRRRC